MEAASDLPDALLAVLNIPALRQGWDSVTESDRSRYATWVAAARSDRSAHRRARVVADRLRDSRGWACQPRRTLQHLFSVPTGTTAEEAYRADHPGSSPTG